jgi:hypothetical protein
MIKSDTICEMRVVRNSWTSEVIFAWPTSDSRTRGMPQQHAHGLVFRHALDVDETGNRLAFGSTAGSWWISGTAATHGTPSHESAAHPCGEA